MNKEQEDSFCVECMCVYECVWERKDKRENKQHLLRNPFQFLVREEKKKREEQEKKERENDHFEDAVKQYDL